MQGNRLETDEIVTGRDGGRDGGRPGRVVGDHLAGAPSAAVDGSRKETGLVNLEPAEAVRVDASTG